MREVLLALYEPCVIHTQGDKKLMTATLETDRKNSWSFVGREWCYRCCFYRQPHIVAYTGLKPMAILPQPPEFWDYSYQAWREKGFFSFVFFSTSLSPSRANFGNTEWPGAHCPAQGSLKLSTLLPQSPQCWDNKSVLRCLAQESGSYPGAAFSYVRLV